MIRNLKVLGLSLVALFAMSAMTASLASAHTPATFTVEAAPATITANQKGPEPHKFTVTGQEVKCNIANFHGTATATAQTSIKITPTYTECTAAGLGAKITGFGHYGEGENCWYTLNADGSAALDCKAGTDVTIDAGTCTVHVPAQSFASGITYTTETTTAGKHDLTVNIHIENITANHTDGFLCPLTTTGHDNTAVLEGSSTATAETDPGNSPLHLTWDATVP